MGFSVLVVFLLQRLKLPSILGFLIAGMLIGPHGLSLVHEVEQVEIISEIGVIMLLFVIGMELSIKHLIAIKKTVFIGGALQVGLTVAVAALICFALGYAWNEAVFVGFLFSLSSTAIVLKVLQDRNEISAPHGRNALAILIFQDIIVVPMMLFTPIIAGRSENVTESILVLLLKTVVVLLITVVSARYLVPRFLYAVAKTKSKELFLLTTIAICFAVAFLTSQAGLSLALGAFLAGLIISESEYSHQATSIILPFRELFTSFFFVSVGMLLDLVFFAAHTGWILVIVLGVFVVKSVIASIATAVLRYPPRTAILTGLALFQIGEFAFILSKVGIEYQLLSVQTNQYFLAVSIVSMFLTPFVMMFSERMTAGLLRLNPFLEKDQRAVGYSQNNHSPQDGALENHLVIIGYGINGTNLSRAAQFGNIPYIVIELNADIVREERKKGVPILFGDATQAHILELAHLPKARAVVIAISDAAATKAIVRNIHSLSQSVYLVVRTRYVKEIPELIALGADEVIPEEFETSIEIFSRVLHNFLIPEDDIVHLIEQIRGSNYEVFQSQKNLAKTFRSSQLPDFNITCLRVTKDSGRLLGKPLNELKLRNEYGVNILGISRKEDLLEMVRPEDIILRDDVLYVIGSPACIEKFRKEIH